MQTEEQAKTKTKKLFSKETRCKDYDEDCEGLRHTTCWLFDPEQGWCPYLTRIAERE